MSSSSGKKIFKSISFRLTFGYALLFILSSFLILFLNYYLFNQSIKDRDHEILISKAKEYSSIYEKGGIGELKKFLIEQKLSDSDSQYLVRIEAENNDSIFLHIPEKMQQLAISDVDKSMASLRFSKNILKFVLKEGSVSDPDELNEYEVSTQIISNGQRIQVARNTDERDDLLERYFGTILSVSFFILVIGSFGGFIFSNQALAPLRDLIQAIKLVRSGQFKTRVPVRSSDDELDEISILFNKMIEKVESLISNMSETLDNVAHDLKTPLTRLRSKAELALLSPSTVEEYQKALEYTVDNISEIVSLINSIMDISEAEVGVLKLDKVELDVNEIILEVIDLYSIVAEEKNILIKYGQATSVKVLADKNRFKQILANLLDNAIKYSPADSEIQILMRKRADLTEISIIDKGCGILSQDLPKIWDRLFRVRSDEGNKGLGLGLSMVHSISKAHGWKVEAQSQFGVGSEFKLSFRTRT